MTDEAVLSLVLGQKMTIETAMVTGLLALDGTPDGVAQTRKMLTSIRLYRNKVFDDLIGKVGFEA